MIKSVNNLRQVYGFLLVLLFPSPIKLTIILCNAAEILLKVALNTIALTPNPDSLKVYCNEYGFFSDETRDKLLQWDL